MRTLLLFVFLLLAYVAWAQQTATTSTTPTVPAHTDRIVELMKLVQKNELDLKNTNPAVTSSKSCDQVIADMSTRLSEQRNAVDQQLRDQVVTARNNNAALRATITSLELELKIIEKTSSSRKNAELERLKKQVLLIDKLITTIREGTAGDAKKTQVGERIIELGLAVKQKILQRITELENDVEISTLKQKIAIKKEELLNSDKLVYLLEQRLVDATKAVQDTQKILDGKIAECKDYTTRAQQGEIDYNEIYKAAENVTNYVQVKNQNGRLTVADSSEAQTHIVNLINILIATGDRLTNTNAQCSQAIDNAKNLTKTQEAKEAKIAEQLSFLASTVAENFVKAVASKAEAAAFLKGKLEEASKNCNLLKAESLNLDTLQVEMDRLVQTMTNLDRLRNTTSCSSPALTQLEISVISYKNDVATKLSQAQAEKDAKVKACEASVNSIRADYIQAEQDVAAVNSEKTKNEALVASLQQELEAAKVQQKVFASNLADVVSKCAAETEYATSAKNTREASIKAAKVALVVCTEVQIY